MYFNYLRRPEPPLLEDDLEPEDLELPPELLTEEDLLLLGADTLVLDRELLGRDLMTDVLLLVFVLGLTERLLFVLAGTLLLVVVLSDLFLLNEELLLTKSEELRRDISDEFLLATEFRFAYAILEPLRPALKAKPRL